MSPGPRGGWVVLDAGGVTAWAEGNERVRAVAERARREGRLVAIPAPVLTEVYTGRYDHARIDPIIRAVDIVIETTAERAKEAGILRAKSGVLDVVDAIVVAEVASIPSIIVSSDPNDIRTLLEAAGATAGVAVVEV